MSGYVCLDASVATKWLLPEDLQDLAVKLYEDSLAAEVEVIAPPHMPVEVINALRRQVARGMITHTEVEGLVTTFLTFSVTMATPPELHLEALRVAETFNWPAAYDAHYIALASVAACDFWTADKRLLNALNARLPFVKSLADYR